MAGKSRGRLPKKPGMNIKERRAAKRAKVDSEQTVTDVTRRKRAERS